MTVEYGTKELTLTDFDITTGQWKVEFDEDEETESINFPEEDVRLLA